MAIQFDHTANGLVTITTTNATSPVPYTLRLPDGTGTVGQFLQTDGTGNLSYASASATYSGLAGKPGVNVTISGNVTGTGNVALLNADTNLLTITTSISPTANLTFNSLNVSGNATVANLIGNVNYTSSIVNKPAANIELTGAVTGTANAILSYPTTTLSIATTYNTTSLDARYLMLNNPAVQSVLGPVGFYGNVLFYGNVTTMTANNLVISDNFIYLNSNSVASNPDFGLVSNYNDGVYRHAGIFRDATDGVFKVFDQYTPEPDANIFIDTSHPSFRLASFAANIITSNGLVVLSSANTGLSNTLVVTGNASIGNLTITGIINLSSLTLGGNLTLPAQGNILTATSLTVPTGNTVFTAGNVGIGGSPTAAKLQITSSADVPLAQFSGPSSGFKINPIGTTTYISDTSGNQSIGFEASTGGIVFYTGLFLRAKIDNAGNVGIGTSNPTNPLHVVGNILSTGNVLATTFIDSDNQAYFLNPAGPVTAVNVLGNVTATTGNINARTGVVYAQSFYDADNTTYFIDPAGPVTAVNVLGNVTATTGNINARTGNVYSQGFYDSDNLSYFLDPANTANSLVLAGNAIVGRSIVTGSNYASNVGINTSIIGGSTSIATGANSYVAGSVNSTTLAPNSVIEGGQNNFISALSVNSDIFGATLGNISILGAGPAAGNSFIVGGVSNKITSNNSSIIGGVFNTASANNSSIIGGINNSITNTIDYRNHGAIVGSTGSSFSTTYGPNFIGGATTGSIVANAGSGIIGGINNAINTGGDYSFIGGGGNGTIGQSYASMLAAYNATINGTFGGIYNGQGSTVSQGYGVVFGSYAIAEAKGKFVLGVNSIPPAGTWYGNDYSTTGRTQIGKQILFSNTSPTYGNIFLNSDGYSTGAPERADNTIAKSNTIGPFRNNTVFTIKGIVNAANSTGTVKVWEFTTVAKRGASDSTLKFVGSYGNANAIINTIAADPGTTNWAMSLYANTSTGVVTVVASTPGVTDNVRWMTSVETTEMAYA